MMKELNFINKLKKITVRIQCKGLIGSGIIYWPDNDDTHCYIFTAKHCILGENLDNGAVAADVLVDKIYKDEIDWESYHLIASEQLLYSADDSLDFAILKIDKSILSEKAGKIPSVKLMQSDDERIPCQFKGYPFLKKNETAMTMDGTLDFRDGPASHFQIRSADNFMHSLRIMPGQQVKGLSGSGVCVNIKDDIYLYGIVNQYEAGSHRFLCTAIEAIRTEFLSTEKKCYYEVERVLPQRWFTEQLHRSSKNLEPRYNSKKNFPVALQPKFDTIGRTDDFLGDINERFLNADSAMQTHLRWKKSRSASLVNRHGAFRIDKDEYKLKRDITLAKAIAEVERVYLLFHNNFTKVKLESNRVIPANWLTLSANKVYTAGYVVINGLNNRALNYEPSLTKKEANEFLKVVAQLHEVINTMEAFMNFVSSERALINAKTVLVSGPAGNGKSQVMAFVANAREQNGAPSVMILGQRLSKSGNPWGQILRELELDCSKEDFLTALNRKGELAGKFALIFLDALNEGQDLSLWPRNFTDFADSLKTYPMIKLVMSYRSSFKQALFKHINLRTIPDLPHPGFAGFQREAMAFFFDIYHINPVIKSVTLIESFENPLFLKLFCMAYQSGSFSGDVDSAQGQLWIIERFLGYVNEQLADREQYDYHAGRINLVRKSVEAFVKRAIDKGVSALTYEEVFVLIENAVDTFLNKKGFLNGLIDEEVYYENGDEEADEQVMLDFSYEKFGDHLKVRYLLRDIDEQRLRDSFLPSGKLHPFFGSESAFENNKGLMEALAMQVKEKFGKDIYDIAPTIRGYKGTKQSFIYGMARSEKTAVSPELAAYVQKELDSDSQLLFGFWSLLLPVSYDSSLFFNAVYLHRSLLTYPMAKRDALWTIFIHHGYPDDNRQSGVGQLLAVANQTAELTAEQLSLLVTTLTWLLTSANRGLRDQTTKVLIRILADQPQILTGLLKDFDKVDDPYVLQRLYGVAYGCAVRSADNDSLMELGQSVYTLIFRHPNIRPDVLLRDYARSVIEYGIYRGIKFSFPLDKIRPPYSSEPFESLPTNEEVDILTSGDYAAMRESGKMGLKRIMDSMVTEYGRGTSRYGDFGRYTFGSAVRHWRDVNENGLSNLAVKMILEKYGYNLPSLGRFDSGDYRRRATDNSSLERIGKKYQWIALHEILAVLADNYDFYPDGSMLAKEKGKYEGPWNPFVRDIDPTLLNPLSPEKAPWDVEKGWNKTFDQINDWLAERSNIPDVTSFAEFMDEDGFSWLVLQSAPVWEEVYRENTKFPQEIWLQLRSYLVPSKEAAGLIKWAATQDFMGRWMPESANYYQLFNREYYWAPVANGQLASEEMRPTEEIYDPVAHHRVGAATPTAAEYIWDTSRDNSRERSTSMLKPSRTVMELLELSYPEADGKLVNGAGDVICYDPSISFDTKPCLVVRKKELLEILKKHELKLIWTLLAERGNSVNYTSSRANDGPRITFSGIISIQGNKLHQQLRVGGES